MRPNTTGPASGGATRWTRRAVAATAAVAAALLATGMTVPAASAAPLATAKPVPQAPASAPALTPEDGAWLEGAVTVAADATTAGDPVSSLVIDGQPIGATTTPGVSHLRFDVGSNSAALSFHNWLVVNGHRIDQDRTWVSERVDIEVPNEWLVTGENIVEIHVGASDAACGLNYDDFVVTDVGLELLGEVADGEDNPVTFSFGDGDCGTQAGDILEAELSFFVLGDPMASTGLAADVDTTTLANGAHQIVATTAAGGAVTHAVSVNNAPVGAPVVAPVDGTLAHGIQTVSASQPAGDGGGVASPHGRRRRAAGRREPRHGLLGVQLRRRVELHRAPLPEPPARQRPQGRPPRRLRQHASGCPGAQPLPRVRRQHDLRGRGRHQLVVRCEPRRLHHLEPRARREHGHERRHRHRLVVRDGRRQLRLVVDGPADG